MKSKALAAIEDSSNTELLLSNLSSKIFSFIEELNNIDS